MSCGSPSAKMMMMMATEESSSCSPSPVVNEEEEEEIHLNNRLDNRRRGSSSSAVAAPASWANSSDMASSGPTAMEQDSVVEAIPPLAAKTEEKVRGNVFKVNGNRSYSLVTF